MMKRPSQSWIVGDVHGCARTFEALLERLDLDLDVDRVVLAGDLVNRGPASLEALRLAARYSERMGPRLEMVLGNHDLHLIAVALGVASERRGDTLGSVLAAPDRDDLLDWLRRRPLLCTLGDRVVVHAGLDPGWSWEQAHEKARTLEQALRSGDAAGLLRRGPERSPSQEDLAVFSRLRTWDLSRRHPNDEFSGPPEEAPEGSVAWYEVPTLRPPRPLAFGHWAAHGRRILRQGQVIALDSGCAWGGELSAVRLEDLAVVAEPLRD